MIEALLRPEIHIILFIWFGIVVLVTSAINHLTIYNLAPRSLTVAGLLFIEAIVDTWVRSLPFDWLTPSLLFITFLFGILTSTFIAHVFGTQRKRLLRSIADEFAKLAAYFYERAGYGHKIPTADK